MDDKRRLRLVFHLLTALAPLIFVSRSTGICTAAKNAMCDDAYQAMTGSNNNRAKCCPSTSGCVKGPMNVVATATCGNVCGTSCLGDESNPGNNPGYSPSTFCIFGQRVCEFLIPNKLQT